MSTGKLEQVCLDCAIVLQEEREKSQETVDPGSFGDEAYRDGKTLYRAELYSADGSLVSFIAIPRDPRQFVIKPLRKPKKIQLSVRTLHDVSLTPVSTPPIRVHSNARVFDAEAESFWVRKTPPSWDALTGIDYISIPTRNIREVVRRDEVVEARLHDGRVLRVFYK